MPITVIVRSATGSENARLTFDSGQRVVIGRGAGSDVRLPDTTVSHRHASLRVQGTGFVVFDEGSMNGTFVGDVRVAARTSRILRPGSAIRLGRVWLEVRMEQSPVTRDLAVATRDLALALVAQAMAEGGADPTPRVRVVEGRDQGVLLSLAEEGRSYVIGRGAECDLPIADGDASREHVRFIRRDGSVYVTDLGAKNGTWLGETRLARDGEVLWRSVQMVQIGRTVLALEEPLNDALARIESAPDESMTSEAGGEPTGDPSLDSGISVPATGEPAATDSSASAPAMPAIAAGKRLVNWSIADGLVMTAALVILALSLAGLVWLLRG